VELDLVWRDAGLMVEKVEEGDPNPLRALSQILIAYAALLERLALRARTLKLGLWGRCPHTPYAPTRGVSTGHLLLE
jgi:hypothetical protein